jgi:hypothetical protein
MNRQKAFVSVRLSVWTTIVAAICGVAVVTPCARVSGALINRGVGWSALALPASAKALPCCFPAMP